MSVISKPPETGVSCGLVYNYRIMSVTKITYLYFKIPLPVVPKVIVV